MLGWTVIGAVALAGCGRLNFDLFGDGEPTDGAPPDLWPDAPMLGSFGAPVVVPNLDSPAEDDDPTLPGDQLEIIFSSGRVGGPGGGTDIYTSTRATLADLWSAPAPVPGLDTGDDETNPDLSVDGLTLYFTRGGSQTVPHDLFFVTRPDRASAWSAPQPLVELNTPGHEVAASPDPDHLALVFTRENIFFITTRATTADPWTTPVAIDFGIVASQAWLGKTVIYFSAEPTSTQIWFAVRTGPQTFGPATPVTELNVGGSTNDPWVSPDLSTIYFSRNDVIMMATR